MIKTHYITKINEKLIDKISSIKNFISRKNDVIEEVLAYLAISISWMNVGLVVGLIIIT